MALLEVSDDGAERSFLRPLPPSSAEAIAPELAVLLAEAGLAPGDLSCVAVLAGPGSFTGLRAGIAFARGLSRALGVPFRPLGTFAAAVPALPERSPAVLVLDAGRGEVHMARFDGSRLDVDVSPVPSAEARAVAGGGGARLVDLASPPFSLALAAARLAAAGGTDWGGTSPAYGRRSAAEEKLEGGGR
jgi:tRNA threonylcarbamoyladenosine biosynthesis protein TsaB